MDQFDLYSKEVMKYFKKPKNIGVIKNADGIGTVGNPKCGDVMKVYIKIGTRPIGANSKQLSVISKKSKTNSDNRKPITENYIKDIKVQTLGCGAAIATSSIMTEMVKGLSIKDALKVTNREVTAKLGGLPKVKLHCSVLSEQGIQAALKDYENKKNK